MNRSRSPRNAFGALLVVVAALFTLTAWLDYLATLRLVRGAEASQGEAGAGLMTFFRHYGAVVLFVLLAGMVLAAALVVLRGRRPDGDDR